MQFEGGEKNIGFLKVLIRSFLKLDIFIRFVDPIKFVKGKKKYRILKISYQKFFLNSKLDMDILVDLWIQSNL